MENENKKQASRGQRTSKKESKLKNLAPLYILKILHRHSDYEHPLTQAQIAAYLRDECDFTAERKAIGRNIGELKEAGYEIESVRGGTYLAGRRFEDSELRLLIDGVLQSKHVTAKHSADLIEKLCSLSSKHFRSHLKNVYSVNEWSKTENRAVFLNIDLFDKAIGEGKKVEFRYNKYEVDGKLHPRSLHRVSPYQLILQNQRYYLLGHSDFFGGMSAYRMDKISNMKVCNECAVPIATIKGYENGIDYKRISAGMPYMYTDLPQRIEFIADVEIADQVVDWFGKDVRMTVLADNAQKMRVSLIASPLAMEHWATQYVNHVVVTKPDALREKIKKSLEEALKNY